MKCKILAPIIIMSLAMSSVTVNADGWGDINFKKTATIDETVLYDENDVVITATELNYGNWEAELMIHIDNNSDTDLSFLAETLGYSRNAINDYMIETGYIGSDVESGGSADEIAKFGYSELLLHGITEIGEIQIGFMIEDADYNRFYTGPLSVKTSSYGVTDAYEELIQSKALQYNIGYDSVKYKKHEFYESEGVCVESVTLFTKEDKHLATFEVCNNNDDTIIVNFRDAKINGELTRNGVFEAGVITPGKKMQCGFALDDLVDNWESFDNIVFTVVAQNTGGMTIAEPKEIGISF